MPTTGRLAEPQRRRERLLDRAGDARQLGERQRPAADARDGLLELARRRAPRGARPAPAPSSIGSSSIRSTGISRRARSGIGQERERPLERRERQLVGAQRPLQRMPAQPLDELRAADDDPRLRPAEQLVAGEADEVGAGGEARGGGRLVADVEERAGAEVVDEREPGSLRDPRQLLASGPRR